MKFQKLSTSVLALTSFVGISSFSQTQNALYGNCGNFVECARASAEQDLANVKKIISEKVSSQREAYSMCQADELVFQQHYDEWFLKNYSQFKKIDDAVTSAIRNANKQLTLVMGQTVSMIAVDGQTENEKPISIKDLIEYFDTLNARLKGKTEEERAIILRQQENPALNSLRISHSQAMDVTGRITVNMNASLKDLGARFELGLNPDVRHFDLEVRIKVPVGGVTEEFHFSMLTADTKIEISEVEKWRSIVRSQVKVDGLAIDGAARYRMMQFQSRERTCQSTWKRIPRYSGLPFVRYSDLDHLEGAAAQKMMWKRVKELPMGFVNDIAVTAQSTLVALFNGNIHQTNASGTWTRISNDNFVSVAVTKKGKVLGSNYKREVKSIENSVSTKVLDGPIAQLEEGSDDSLLGIDGQGNLVESRSGSGLIIISRGNYSDFAAAPNQKLFVVDDGGVLYEGVRDGRTELKLTHVTTSKNTNEKIVQIVSDSDSVIFGLSDSGTIYELDENASGRSWSKVADSVNRARPVVKIAIASEGKIYGIQSNGILVELR